VKCVFFKSILFSSSKGSQTKGRNSLNSQTEPYVAVSRTHSTGFPPVQKQYCRLWRHDDEHSGPS